MANMMLLSTSSLIILSTLVACTSGAKYMGVTVNELKAPTTPPAVPADFGYTLNANKACEDMKESGQDLGFAKFNPSKYSGTVDGRAPGLPECKKACESLKNCIGFSFTSGSGKSFECKGFEGPKDATQCKDGSVAGYADKAGSNLYIRDAGLVATEVPDTTGWAGDGPAAPTNFTAYAGYDCSGGDAGELIKANSGGTVAECAALCVASASCDGIAYKWKLGSSTLNRCMAKTKAKCTPVARGGQTFYHFTGTHPVAPTGDNNKGDNNKLGSGSAATASLVALTVAAAAAIKMF